MNQVTPISTTGAIAIHRIEIKRTHWTSSGARFEVTHNGKTLIESSRDPEHDACRALLAKGLTGTLETYHPGGTVARMRLDIERGAKLGINESAKTNIKTVRWSPYPGRIANNPTDDAE